MSGAERPILQTTTCHLQDHHDELISNFAVVSGK